MINLSCLIVLSVAFFQFTDTRKILILGTDESQIKTQLEWLKRESKGAEDRDIEVIVTNDKKSLAHFEITSSPFTIILIGKDRTEKFRSIKPVTPQTLFDIIDTMPMRRSELREK
jgi:hypothetical protein